MQMKQTVDATALDGGNEKGFVPLQQKHAFSVAAAATENESGCPVSQSVGGNCGE